jgi:uncharacterized LabA/DUF88 family protein
MNERKNNLAFIDGQNLYLGTKQDGWSIDLSKLKIYLQDKYNVKEAYYFIGYLQEENNELYKEIQKAGFIVIFKDHNEYAISKKKGNVDTDIVFEIMKNLIENIDFDKIVLVSGDGDYKKLVDYLIEKDRFKRILFPNGNKASSLYNKLDNKFKLSLDRQTIRQFIENK